MLLMIRCPTSLIANFFPKSWVLDSGKRTRVRPVMRCYLSLICFRYQLLFKMYYNVDAFLLLLVRPTHIVKCRWFFTLLMLLERQFVSPLKIQLKRQFVRPLMIQFKRQHLLLLIQLKKLSVSLMIQLKRQLVPLLI